MFVCSGIAGDRPIVVARGGFSGLLPDSSEDAYKLASIVSSPDVILWCDVQLTKDGVGICFPDIRLTNGSNIGEVFKKKEKVYTVNGLQVKDWFPVDFTHSELQKVTCKSFPCSLFYVVSSLYYVLMLL